MHTHFVIAYDVLNQFVNMYTYINFKNSKHTHIYIYVCTYISLLLVPLMLPSSLFNVYIYTYTYVHLDSHLCLYLPRGSAGMAPNWKHCW